MHGIVDEKTDVFAFGVLLLELVTGRRALDYSRQSLVLWVCMLLCFVLTKTQHHTQGLPCIYMHTHLRQNIIKDLEFHSFLGKTFAKEE